MKDVYGRPIYRLERVRGNKARYQNSETAQWTPWLMPTMTEVGFPDKLNERDMAALLYSWSVRRGMKIVARQMREFGKVIRSIGEKMRLEHPEALTKALDEAVTRHPAGSKLSRNVTVLPVDDEHPDFGDVVPFRDLSEDQKQARMDADVARYEHFKANHQGNKVIELPLPKSAQVTLEQAQMQEHLSKLRVPELRDWMGDVIDGKLQENPEYVMPAWKKFKKAEIIDWLVANCDPWEVGLTI